MAERATITKEDLDRGFAQQNERLDRAIGAQNEKLDTALQGFGARLDQAIGQQNERLEKVAEGLHKSGSLLAERVDRALGQMSEKLDKVAEGVHKNGVLLEELRGNVRAESEARTAATDKLSRELAEVEDRLGQRITTLEQVVREHSAQLHDQSAQLRDQSTELRRLASEVADLRARFDRRDFDALEQRVSLLEKRVAGG